jgi:DNA modification methylase
MISEVYNCDCIKYMETIPDKYFDLVIADPPYSDPNNEIGGGKDSVGGLINTKKMIPPKK